LLEARKSGVSVLGSGASRQGAGWTPYGAEVPGRVAWNCLTRARVLSTRESAAIAKALAFAVLAGSCWNGTLKTMEGI